MDPNEVLPFSRLPDESMTGSSMRLVRLKPQGRTARYIKNLQNRTRTTLGPEISRQKICGLVKICGLLKFLESDALVDNLNV